MRVRTGRLPDDEWKRLSMGAGRLAKAKIFIDDTAGLGILELRAKARRLKAEHNAGLIIVDYLQLMQGPRSAENREKEISAISRSLKALAKELDIPVIALSQLSRAVEGTNGQAADPLRPPRIGRNRTGCGRRDVRSPAGDVRRSAVRQGARR